MSRAVILIGAGASIDFGVPSTAKITNEIEQFVKADEWMGLSGGAAAFQTIKLRLGEYLSSPDVVNFEHIYHCAHELMFISPHTDGALDEYRPILNPFICNLDNLTKYALRALCHDMTKVIYERISRCCDDEALNLASLTAFLEKIESKHITRIYTTNYDDLVLQAAPHLYTGFSARLDGEPRRFKAENFWAHENTNAVFHLHGSVHLGFPHPIPKEGDIGELYWFDNRAEALEHSSFHGSDDRRMDGSSVLCSAIITGLDKLSRLQQRPMSHYYSAMARDMMTADIIYVIGSGLTDIHLNTWLKEARTKNPKPPILIIDLWPRPFLEQTAFDLGRKEIKMIHTLRVHSRGPFSGTKFGTGWTLSPDRTSAIWDKGLQKFLLAPNELDEILHNLDVGELA
jgi:NAD-dependent SIR2 family protein deacetylase